MCNARSIELAGLVVCLLVSTTVVHAGTNVWTSGGPIGGSFQALAIDPGTPTVLYAGSEDGVIKSLDGGVSWSVANTGLNTSGSRYVHALAIHPTNSATVYASTFDGVFRTTDAGSSWTRAHNGIPGDGTQGSRAVAIAPSLPSTVYAAVSTLSHSLFRSTDGGASWTAASSGLPSNQPVYELVADTLTPTTAYAAVSFMGVFKTVDSGASWAASNNGLTNLSISGLAIDPSNPSTLYAGTSSGVFKTTDAGGTWALISTAVPGASTFVVDPSTPATVYAGSSQRIAKSVNGGTTWTTVLTGPYGVDARALALHSSSPATVLAALGNGTFGDSAFGGVLKSTDGGVNWAATAAAAFTTMSVAVDPASPATLLLGTVEGVFKSVNGGSTWFYSSGPTLNLLKPNAVPAVVIDASNGATAYAATLGEGVFKTTDGGGTWTQKTNGLSNDNLVALVADPTVPTTLYAGTLGNGVYKSVNGADAWSNTASGLGNLNVYALAVDPLAPSTLYAGTATGVFKTTNAATTWTSASVGLPSGQRIRALAADPTTAGTLYAGTSFGVYKSVDAAASWVSVNTGISDLAISAVVIDPMVAGTVFAGSVTGVFQTTNGGASWGRVSSGLPSTEIAGLAVDATPPRRLHAATQLGLYNIDPLPQSTATATPTPVATPNCGNGIREGAEACDDGNLTAGDGCESNCTLTPGCTFAAATDVPRPLPDLASTTSSIMVSTPGLVTNVQVLGLRGTHTFVGDLEFHVVSPAGIDVVAVARVCGGNDNFDLSLSDAAVTAIPCPPTDGASHRPSNSFNAFSGSQASGQWSLTIFDRAGGDIGTLTAWSLLVCGVAPVATPTLTPPPATPTATPAAPTATATSTATFTAPLPTSTAGNPTPTPTGVPLCAASPEICRTPAVSGKAFLSISDKASDEKDQFQWKWLAGAITSKSEFGDPVGSDDYVLCVYDGGNFLDALVAPAGGTCAAKPCWTEKPKGFHYKDKQATPSGVTQLQLSEGADGKAKILLKGKGLNLPELDLSALSSPLTLQLRRPSGGVCFGATYTFPPAIKNDGLQFKDKAD